MNPAVRHVVRRELHAAARRPEPPGPPDAPLRAGEPLRRGMARIVSNDGDGKYTITERWWDPTDQAWRDATAPLGIVAETAFDRRLNATGGARDDLVYFWEERAVGGGVVRFIDLGRLGGTAFRAEGFCGHYSGTNDWEFFSIPGSFHAFGGIGVELRACSGDAAEGDHPGYAAADLAGWVSQGYSLGNWINTCGAPSDWAPLAFSGFEADGVPDWSPPQLEPQWKVDGNGDLRLRVRRTADPPPAAHVSCVIMGFVMLVYYPPLPGDLEGGNFCCHEQPNSSWGDGEWSN